MSTFYSDDDHRAKARIHAKANRLGLEAIRNRKTWILVDPTGDDGEPKFIAYRVDNLAAELKLNELLKARRTP